MSRPRILRSLPTLLCLAAAAAPLAVSGCGKGGAENGPAASAGRALHSVPVEVRPVKSRTVVYVVQAVGSLEAREVLRLPARVAGVVQDIAFQEGTPVTPDLVLGRIDPERYALAAQRAEANHRQAEAEAREAEAALDKRRALHARDPGWVTEEELTNFTAQLDGARAAVAAARAASDLARKDLADSELRVDYPGVIDEKRVDTGQYVSVGTVLATVVDTGRLKLSFRVTESESGRLSEGTPVTFRVKAVPGRDFPARIYHVGEVADPSTRMVECLAWVDNRERLLRPGFFADVIAEVESREHSVVVPQAAVLPTEHGYVAWVLRGEDEVERRQVQLGLFTRDGEVEILDGLRAGEPLVVRGAALLSEGARVSVDAGRAPASGPSAGESAPAAAPEGRSAP